MTRQVFEDILVRELPDVPETERYAPADRDRVAAYLPAIATADERGAQLDPDFVRVDGALLSHSGRPPRVEHIAAAVGKEPVNNQIELHGRIEGFWLTKRSYLPIEAQVNEQLPKDVSLPGRLLGAAAVCFPCVLKPGGDPLQLPQTPQFRSLLRRGEKPFAPLKATGKAEDDLHTVNVVQAVYGNNRLITARVGLVWDDDRAVPFAINRQILARRAGTPLSPKSPLVVAWHLDVAAVMHRRR